MPLYRAVEQNSSGTYKQILYSPMGGKLALMAQQVANNVFLPLPGGEQATYTNSTIRFRHYDWQGSARFESTQSETEYGDLAYAPFGETYSIGKTPYLSFTGQQQDTVSGMYDFLYRRYNPGEGRWISPDPSGVNAVNPSNPQSWNRYTYVANAPLSATDPLGLDASSSDGCFGGDLGGRLECILPDGGGGPPTLAGAPVTPIILPATIVNVIGSPDGAVPENLWWLFPQVFTPHPPPQPANNGCINYVMANCGAPNNGTPQQPQQTPQQPKKQPWYCGTGNSWSHPFTAPTGKQWGQMSTGDLLLTAAISKYTKGKDPISETLLFSGLVEAVGWANCP